MTPTKKINHKDELAVVDKISQNRSSEYLQICRILEELKKGNAKHSVLELNKILGN